MQESCSQGFLGKEENPAFAFIFLFSHIFPLSFRKQTEKQACYFPIAAFKNSSPYDAEISFREYIRQYNFNVKSLTMHVRIMTRRYYSSCCHERDMHADYYLPFPTTTGIRAVLAVPCVTKTPKCEAMSRSRSQIFLPAFAGTGKCHWKLCFQGHIAEKTEFSGQTPECLL